MVKNQKCKIVSGNSLKEEGCAPKQPKRKLNIPNIDELLDTVITLLENIKKPEIKKLKKESFEEYEDILYKDPQYFILSRRSYSLFRKIIDGEDITYFFNMIQEINSVKNDETHQKASQRFENMLIQKHVSPEQIKQLKNGKKIKPKK